jgi:pimeloyl-ACP methyl ester carboxylesterase
MAFILFLALLLLFLGTVLFKTFLYGWRWIELNAEESRVSEDSFYPFKVSGRSRAAFWYEVLVEFLTPLTYPLAPLVSRSLERRRRREQPLIVLVHGYGLNLACFGWFARQLQARGFGNVVPITLQGKYGDIHKMAEYLDRRLRELQPDPDRRDIFLIGHSMGGLVIRTYLHHCGGIGRVAGAVCLASPHQGTRLGPLGVGYCARQLTAGSRFMTDLLEREAELDQLPFWTFWSSFDAFMAPPTTAGLANGRHAHELAWHGHVAFLYSREVVDRVVACVRQAPGMVAAQETADTT